MKTSLSLAIFLFIFALGINCLDLPLLGGKDKPFEISPQNLSIPENPGYSPHNFASKPAATAKYSPGYSSSIRLITNSFYRDSNSEAKIFFENSGDNPVFIYRYGVRPDWMGNDWYSASSGITVNPGEEKYVGMISFKVDKKGTIALKPGVSMMVKTREGNWYDYGTVFLDSISFSVKEPKPNESQYEFKYNNQQLFQKVNTYITPEDLSIKAMAMEIVQKYPGKYNVYQLCSVFDAVSKNIAYVSEPEGVDYWQYPNETLRIKSGDCEDHAFLLASLIRDLGGTARLYGTDDHMFAAVYIGEANNTQKVAEAITLYYNTPVTLHYQTDKYGAWLVLESSGGFYAGSLPVGGVPTANGGWTFNNITALYAIDVRPN